MVKMQQCSGENIVHSRAFEAGIRVLNRGMRAECWIQILTEALKKARISWLTVLVHHGVS